MLVLDVHQKIRLAGHLVGAPRHAEVERPDQCFFQPGKNLVAVIHLTSDLAVTIGAAITGNPHNNEKQDRKSEGKTNAVFNGKPHGITPDFVITKSSNGYPAMRHEFPTSIQVFLPGLSGGRAGRRPPFWEL